MYIITIDLCALFIGSDWTRCRRGGGSDSLYVVYYFSILLHILFAVTLSRSTKWRHRKRLAQAATDLETPPSARRKEYTCKKCGQKMSCKYQILVYIDFVTSFT